MNRALLALALSLPSLAGAAETGQPAPVFPALEAQRGKVVLVDFWASCRNAARPSPPATSRRWRGRACADSSTPAMGTNQSPH